MEKEKVAKTLRYTAGGILLVITCLVFMFALLSGAERYGGGVKGILLNSPNALPWFLLLIFVFIAWKWELAGGIVITLTGLLTIFFFDFYNPKALPGLFVISLPLIILGGLFILSWYIKR